jgi:hypothetical protein
VRSVLVAVAVAIAIVDFVAASRGSSFSPLASVVRCGPLYLPFPFPILVVAFSAFLPRGRGSLLLRPLSPSLCKCRRFGMRLRVLMRLGLLAALLLPFAAYLFMLGFRATVPFPARRRLPSCFLCVFAGPALLFFRAWFPCFFAFPFSPLCSCFSRLLCAFRLALNLQVVCGRFSMVEPVQHRRASM